MKIVLTGSLGHIGNPLTRELTQKEHSVTVISSNPEKQRDIEALGAKAAIGSVDDVAFLTSTFTGADAVYCMVPPTYHADHKADPIAHYHRVGQHYAQAVRESGVKRVIHLSSIGAHVEKDSGLILGHHAVEQIFRAIPGITLTHMRPTAFYYNLFGFIAGIKKNGFMAANYGAGDRVPWVSPLDIATAVADEITTASAGLRIRYVASDEPTCAEIAQTLGAAIGKPDLTWQVISDEQMLTGMQAAGVPPLVAAGLTKTNAHMHTGVLLEDYYRNRPAVLGKIKIADFAREFAAVYAQR